VAKFTRKKNKRKEQNIKESLLHLSRSTLVPWKYINIGRALKFYSKPALHSVIKGNFSINWKFYEHFMIVNIAMLYIAFCNTAYNFYLLASDVLSPQTAPVLPLQVYGNFP
jgi:hypothetical protein